MKVLHVSTPMSWRGGEQQLYYLVQGLTKLNIESVVFCSNGGELQQRLQKENRKWIGFNKSISVNPFVALKLKQQAQLEKADIIHTHDSHAHTIAVLASALGMKTPIVVHRRVDYPIKEKRLNRWKYNHPSIRKFICVSNKIKHVMARTVRDQEKLSVVYSGIDPSRFAHSTKGKLRAILSLDNTTPIVANIAAISHQKDYITWVRAVGHLVKKRQDIRFVVIGGDGGELELVKTEIKRLQLEKHIDLMGYRTDIPDLIKDIDVLMFSSRDEGLGTSILDAFMNKVPVVSTNAGGIPEMIIHEETGLLSDVEDDLALADSCLRIMEDLELKNKIVDQAFEKQKSFHYELMVDKVAKIYEQYSLDLAI